jgi:acyl carrier protein
MNDTKMTSKLIKDVIAAELGLNAGAVSDDNTIEDLGLDSLAFAEVVVSLERHFKTMIDTTTFVEDLTEKTTVGELIAIFSTALFGPVPA